jgi:hypothetical protein
VLQFFTEVGGPPTFQFVHIPPDNPAYNPDHVYTYQLFGEGPLEVRLLDSNTRDNYGRLEVIATPNSTSTAQPPH